MPFDHCFSSEDLSHFLTDTCKPAAVTDMVQHVETCSHCQKQLEILTADVQFESQLAQHAAMSVAKLLPPHHRIVQWKALGNVQHVRTKVSGKVNLEFLRPTKAPDALGMFGNYLVLDVIGQGGMGIVLQARDEVLHRMVAVKVLSPELAQDHHFRQRFLREARAAAAIVHDNVVPINKVGKIGDLLFIEMQLIVGQSLQHTIQRSGALSLGQIIPVGSDIADGLAAAHRQGLIHLDIKPANILLDEQSGRGKITDFGVARLCGDSRLTAAGFSLGTPEYMSPEQAMGNRADYRSDFFSLGSVLYTLCTGRNPFSGPMESVLQQVQHKTARPIHDTHPELPDTFCHIIERLHEKRPENRYQSATEVRQALQTVAIQNPQKTVSQKQQPGPSISLVAILGGTFSLLALIAVLLWENPSDINSINVDTEAIVSPPTLKSPPIKCLHKDGSWQAAQTLETALRNCRNGDIIELSSDGPFPCGALKIHEKHLVIRAAFDQRPVITIHTAAIAHEDWMDLYNADVKLEGITIRGNRDDNNFLPHRNHVLFCNHSKLTMTHTRIELPTRHPIIKVSGTSHIHLFGSELLSTDGPNLDWIVSQDGTLEIKNCVLTGSIGCVIHLDHYFTTDASVRLTNNTWIGYQALAVVLHSGRRNDITLPVIFSHNVFDTKGAVLLVDGMHNFSQPPPPTELRQLLANTIELTDQENIYSANSSFVFFSLFGPHLGRKVGTDSLSDWNTLWALTENRSFELEGGLGLQDDATHQLNPVNYRLPKSWQDILKTRQLTKLVGVDPEAIGPGPPYHAWRSSQENTNPANLIP